MQSSTAVLRRTTGPHWRTLKLMAGFLKVIAGLIVLAGVALAVVIVLEVAKIVHLSVLPVPPETALPISMVYFVGTALGTALSFLVFNALAELILLLVAIEYNTRRQPF
jgi:hypothetical protein